MVSYHYAKQMDAEPRIPLLVDSGGFASLFEHTRLVESGNLGVLEITGDESTETLHPRDVLDLQERIADIAFTLDFPIPPAMDRAEAHRRLEMTVSNALWAADNRRRKDLLLYACVQAWDAASARECARAYVNAGFDGVAIGGLVPRSRDEELVLGIVYAVRSEIPELPLHVFGLGRPGLVDELFRAGIDSVDSSSYVKLAADGRLWSNPNYQIVDPATTDRLHLAICNLAMATGCSLPLSTTRLVFGTQQLATHGQLSRCGGH